jgi:hypothetical protein
VFDLVLTSCNNHISSIYALLGHPEINFDSFWDVYNQLCEAVDVEFLFHSSIGVFDEGHVSEDDLNSAQLLLSNLRSCEFGEGGVPAGQIAVLRSDRSGIAP